MGFCPFPFVTIQALAWLEENIFGNRNALENGFHWESLKMNLPGSATYDPSKPWVYKERNCDGNIAADCLVYVDDLRPTGPSEEKCWRAMRRVGCQINQHVFQDAAKKRHPVAQDGGPWAGTVVHTTNDRVSVMVTDKRWIKTQKIFRRLVDEVVSLRKGSEREDGSPISSQGVDHKALESDRGFLIYVSQTYPSMVPYRKGIHLILDSWREGRREDGWKRSRKEMDLLRRNSDAPGEVEGRFSIARAVPKLYVLHMEH
jgi:hypothetical protein